MWSKGTAATPSHRATAGRGGEERPRDCCRDCSLDPLPWREHRRICVDEELLMPNLHGGGPESMVVDVVPPDLPPGKAAACSPPRIRRRGRPLCSHHPRAVAVEGCCEPMQPPCPCHICIPPPQPPCPHPSGCHHRNRHAHYHI
jgi:hypothetical protein